MIDFPTKENSIGDLALEDESYESPFRGCPYPGLI